MPELKEEQVTDSQKQTEESSASERSQTASQDGDLAIDPARKYVVNQRTGKTVTGSQVRDVFGEIELKRKVESENAKLKEELSRIQAEFANMQASLSQLQIQKEVANALKGSRKPANTDASDWGMDTESNNEAVPEIDPVNFLNRIEDVTEKIVEKKVGKQTVDVKNLVAQELEQREAQREQAEYAKQVFDVSQRETIRAFKTEMPDISDDDVKEITEKMAVVEALKEESTRAILNGDRDKGADKWHDYVALQRDIYNRLAELKDEQKQLARVKEKQRQLDNLSLGSRTEVETNPIFNKTFHPDKAAGNIALIKQKSKEIEAQLRRLKQP